jgi:hypothetical protein
MKRYIKSAIAPCLTLEEWVDRADNSIQGIYIITEEVVGLNANYKYTLKELKLSFKHPNLHYTIASAFKDWLVVDVVGAGINYKLYITPRD